MIKRIELIRFKKYMNQSFDLKKQGLTLLVGGNNAGKSTLIHALSIWEFCKIVLLHDKGRSAFNQSELGHGEGLGMSAEDFLPIAVPSLNHLWTNLKTQLSAEEKEAWPDQFPGYIMRIKCIWDYHEQTDRMLEIGLSLVNDRLFIRVTNSNLVEDDYLPTVVYLPTFAGVLPKENKVTLAERRAFLGRGMAGSIIRNMIYDLYIIDERIRTERMAGRSRLSKKDKAYICENSPLAKLQQNLQCTFRSELEIEPFNEEFNTMIRINERKVISDEDGNLIVLPKSKYAPRDIITQGSGYLQWLSIFCILYSPGIDVILLDEPDAHLHASLQSELLERLMTITGCDAEKQILVSTHSVEMIKQAPLNMVFSMEERKYLSEESSRVAVLNGVGSEYFPKLDLLKRYKKLIFTENESDEKVLSILGEKCGISFPRDVVFWHNTYQHHERKQLVIELQKIIPNLKCISLRDRDMDPPGEIGEDLEYKGKGQSTDGRMLLIQWRRTNIESYLICPKAIALASGHSVEDVKAHLQRHFAISLNDDGYIGSGAPDPIIRLDGKNIFIKETVGLEKAFFCDKYDVAKNMTADEVCDDIKTFLTRVNTFFTNE